MRLSASLSLLLLAAALSSCSVLHRSSAPAAPPPAAAPAAAEPSTAEAAPEPVTETGARPEKQGFLTRIFSRSGESKPAGEQTKEAKPEAPPAEAAPAETPKLVTKDTASPLTETGARPEKRSFFARLFSRSEESKPADEQPKAEEVKQEVHPTAEQQAAAQELIRKQAEETAAVNTPIPAEEETAAPATPELSTGGLRMRRFAPPEEAVSAQEGEAQALPNAVELHGLRSPELRGGKLPMDINGKITEKKDEETQD